MPGQQEVTSVFIPMKLHPVRETISTLECGKQIKIHTYTESGKPTFH